MGSGPTAPRIRPWKASGNKAWTAGWNGCTDVDIKSFFDTLDHAKLREIVGHRVKDGVIRRLIGKWLKAGVMEQGLLHEVDEGTPQGGVISPMLSNIFLHEVLDKWFAETVKPRLRGRAFLIRYADDFVIGFEREDDARRVLEVLPKRFGKYGLNLHPTKTRLVPFSRTRKGTDGGGHGGESTSFDFLGFTHYWGKSRQGRAVIKRKTAHKRLSRSLKGVSQWMRKHRHWPVREQWAKLKQKLTGHYGYYGITGNAECLEQYYDAVKRLWHKWRGPPLAPKGKHELGALRHLIARASPAASPPSGSLHLFSEILTRRTVCLNWARTGLWGSRPATDGSTRKVRQPPAGMLACGPVRASLSP